jgi:hypothetical protein
MNQLTGDTTMKTMFIATVSFATLMLVAPIGGIGGARAADLSASDLGAIHSEYKANQARWAHEYLGKTFEATMEVDKIGNIFGNDTFHVSFMENKGDWLPGV